MTERKPTGVSFESWVDRQISAAAAKGEFDDLPGAGKPLPKNDGKDTALAWVVNKVRTEGHDVSALLPPSLAIAKELEDLPARLARVRREARVREIVEDLNERIREEHRRPAGGPVLRARPLDVDETVASWREGRTSS
ncbi:DnaJ family domain-containing protein [Amycolatopsis azurea]|uniref:Molecular chaperone DnaJ n=1 Tax=Amycolatopsis azurea DSM 43854 TaxID=1238180 RepID=M2Q8V0_9PSEU|nr:DUF1992 domain-containing protein [Amycolatopsis azurea]EMD22517.1 hypothetical protein C791_8379 [Amycolatopsis azurea DSM 43854]OOC08377.1 molecular chaperone DnaJ [Amycolatopsis azurea DSM 43854]